MTEAEMVLGIDFTIRQSYLKRGFNWKNAKGKQGRGRPKGSKNKHGYKRRANQ